MKMFQPIHSIVFTVLLLLHSLTPTLSRAGKLEEFKKEFQEEEIELEEPAEKKPAEKKPEKTTVTILKDETTEDEDSEWLLALVLFTSPFWLPHYALDDKFSDTYSFLSYPYKGGRRYFLVKGEDTGKNYAGFAETTFEILESGIWAWGLSGGFITDWRLFLDFRFTQFRENVTTPDGGGRTTDTLNLFKGHFMLNFAQHPNWIFSVGLGGKGFNADGSVLSGVDFVYLINIFPAKHFTIDMRAEAGLIRSRGIYELEGRIGYIDRRYSVLWGFRYLKGGDVELTGPELTFRVWL